MRTRAEITPKVGVAYKISLEINYAYAIVLKGGLRGGMSARHFQGPDEHF